MTGDIRPLPHPDPFVDVTRGYITAVADEFTDRGVRFADVWLDPSDPRDATFVLGLKALVWNESDGFVLGDFVSGEPGVRTVLRDPVRLGGGVLAHPGEVAGRLAEPEGGAPVRLRSFTDGHDGFEDALTRYDRR
ncbi:hypothetical protein BJF79_26125 [Actinomadura sp. CNU-125]|uniref:DUF6292 family protein n=1 Tax=Actinomadura sp. CNU-125 TaxID=1904961 RepID=UPI00096884A2|nr:DUF6292 family protein [Actinomadura sp. CNU-125]OLT10381.1 hypothetical protein BJF79_26125 [Actinomadura sp. CNU-125]